MTEQHKNKVLFFINSLKGGGAEQVALNLSEEFAKQNINSVYVTLFKTQNFDTPKYIEEWNLNLSNKKINSYFRFLNIKNVLDKNIKWNAFLKKYSNFNFVLITAHLMTSKFVALNSPFANQTLYVNHVDMNIFNPIELYAYKKYFIKAFNNKKQVCVSDDVYKSLCQNYKLNSSLTKVISNPVKVYDKDTKQQHDKRYILFLGRLEKQKNPLKLLDLYYKGKFYKDFDLIYLGEGKLKTKLLKRIKKYNLTGNVYVKGFINKPYGWIKHASLLASTSLYEGLSLNIIEAFMLNTPVICYDCPNGASKLFKGDLAEYIIGMNNSDEEYIDKMRYALYEKYPKISEKLLNPFQPNIVAKEYIKFYNK